MAEAVQSREAKYGERMIEVKVRFWTDQIAEGEGQILPKDAWTSGVVRMERNESHSIIPKDPRPFNSLMELPQSYRKGLDRTWHCAPSSWQNGKVHQVILAKR